MGVRKKSGDQLHLVWRLTYEPGTLKAVGKRGSNILTEEVKTAKAPAKVVLQADRKSISADGKDLSFITVKILDDQGILVPDAYNMIHFTISGEGKIAGVDNGCETDLEPFKANYRKAFNGMALVVVQSTEKSGTINLEATSDGLQSSTFVIETK
jgi:beta-galactosidase